MSLYPVSVGDLIAGKYLVERFIGEGGMGLVVAARHVELDQQVAIKFLLPQIAEHVTAAQRFRREARAAARIRGDHACRVLDVASLDNGVPYMVMEYLEGCDLASELLRRRRLPPTEAVDYVLQACEALAEAHAGGIVHRDLKPGNFFLAMRSDGVRCLKVLDFGVSKLLTDSDVAPLGLTGTTSMIGSPLYMSPEQLESPRDVDGRTDLWSLGVVLFELITGRTPFIADTLAQLTHQVIAGQAPTCASLGVPVPEGLEQVIARALSKRRDARYASVADLARALVPFGPVNGAVSAARAARLQPGSSAARSGVLRSSALAAAQSSDGAQPQGASPQEPPVHASTTPAAWERATSTMHDKRRIGWIALGALLLLAVAGAVYRVAAPSGAAETAAASQGEHTLPAQGIREHAARDPSLASSDRQALEQQTKELAAKAEASLKAAAAKEQAAEEAAAKEAAAKAAAAKEAAAKEAAAKEAAAKELAVQAPAAKTSEPANKPAAPGPAAPKPVSKPPAPAAHPVTKASPAARPPATKPPVVNITDFGGRR